jgi:hypothetical protein
MDIIYSNEVLMDVAYNSFKDAMTFTVFLCSSVIINLALTIIHLEESSESQMLHKVKFLAPDSIPIC